MGKFTINKNIKKETDDIVKIDKHFYLMFVGICNNINSIHYKYLNTYKKFIPVPKKEISEIPMLKHKISWSENTVFICTQDACMPPMAYPAQVLSYLYS